MLSSLTLAIFLLTCGVSAQKCRISEFHFNQTVGFDEMKDWALLGDPINVSSPEECRDTCCNQEGCESFDLRHDGFCFLVSCGGHCVFKPMENMTSYVIEVIPTSITRSSETVTNTSPTTAPTTIRPETSTSEPQYEEAVQTTNATSTSTVSSPSPLSSLETDRTAKQVANAPPTEPNMTPLNEILSTKLTTVTPGLEKEESIAADVTSPQPTMKTTVMPSDSDVLLISTMLPGSMQTSSDNGAGSTASASTAAGPTASASTAAGQLEATIGSQIDTEGMTVKRPVSAIGFTNKPITPIVSESSTENPITSIVTESLTEKPITPIVTESVTAKPITSDVADGSTEKPITVVFTESATEKPITSVITERTSDKLVTFTTTKKTTMRPTTRSTKTHPQLVSSTKSAVGPMTLATKENTTPPSKQFTTTQLFSINHLNHFIHNKERQPMLMGVLFLCIILTLAIVFISIKACRKCCRVGKDKKGYHKLKFIDDQDWR